MNTKRSALTQFALSALVLLLAACGGGNAPTSPGNGGTTPPTGTPTPTPPPGDSPAPGNPAVNGKSVTYTESSEVFLNPERGLRPGVQLGHGIGTTGMAGVDLAGMRGRGSTVIQGYVSLENFRSGPISETYLGQMRGRLQGLRDAGIKASLRFWYTWGGSGDVPIATILNHVRQLTPLLREYADVILALQAGFFGGWGEWGGGYSADQRRELVRSLAAALPADRKVQIRTVDYLRLFVPGGMTEAQAFDASSIASRIGHHNDCFLVNQSDAGTYAWSDPQRTIDRNYLQAMTRYMPVGGEMCGDVPEQGSDPYNRRTPEGQLAELARFNWSWIAGDFGNVGRWRTWGIYDTISRNLGYRLVLTQSVVPEVAGNRQLTMSFTFKNVGWAAPVNPRKVRIILRGGGQSFAVEQPVEARKWYAGGTYTVTVNQPLPTSIPAGTYQVLLHLADPYPTLTARPEYAIRTANSGLWEPGTGFNNLNQTVRVP
ncbi:MAG: DUF4832 domain-containing protein [Meiothermus sp.]|nr:DUF4832 domain-containing protein [Meiothermus sp.]